MDSKVAVAVIGAGYWGPNLIRNLYETDKCELKIICDSNNERINIKRGKYPDVNMSVSADCVVENKTIDAVCIATPVNTHYELAKAALKSGKHVFIEKPITTTSQEAFKLHELAQESGKVLMVGHIYKYNPAVDKIRELIRSDALGDINFIQAVRTSLGPRVRNDVNIVLDYGIHEAYIFPYILDQNPIGISANGSSYLQQKIEDWVSFTQYFENTTAIAYATWCDPRKRREMTIVGSKKMLVYDDLAENKITVYNSGYKSYDGIDSYGNVNLQLYSGGSENITYADTETLGNEVDHFFDCIYNKKKPKSSGEDGVEVMRICEAISDSMKMKGKSIEL